MQRGSCPPVPGQGAGSTVPTILLVKTNHKKGKQTFCCKTHKHLRLAIKLSQNQTETHLWQIGAVGLDLVLDVGHFHSSFSPHLSVT